MTRALSRAEVRELDRRAIEEFGIPGVVLMENAGRGAAELLLSLGVHGPVVICCGKGNNGGDGFVMARHLDIAGCKVGVLFFGKPRELRGDAATNYRILDNMRLMDPYPSLCSPGDRTLDMDSLRKEFASADWIVDALFGTGLNGPLSPPFDQLVNAINSARKKVFAVDIPSGMDCDSGQPLGPTVRANHTATFVASKTGFLEPHAREWTGEVHVLHIGAPKMLVEHFLKGETYLARPS